MYLYMCVCVLTAVKRHINKKVVSQFISALDSKVP